MILVFICAFVVSRAVGELSVIDNVVTVQDLDDDNKHNKGNYRQGIQVKTEQGLVRGYQDESGIVTFFDIPYGEFSKEQPFQVRNNLKKFNSWSNSRVFIYLENC